MYPLFCLPNDITKKIIENEINYNTISKDKVNEKVKKENLEKQAKVNSALEKNHSAICSVLQEKCKKESCILYKKLKIEDGELWACQEYKVDFPTADFDLKYHVAFIGTNKVNVKASRENLEEIKKQGGNYFCKSCANIYKKTREELKNDEGVLEVCNCEGFLFKPIEEFTEFLKKKEMNL